MTWWSLTCNITREWRLMMEEARLFVIRQFCPVEVEILVREADIVGPP